MSFSPIADFSFKKLTDITPDFLLSHGISLLMMDLDNTLAPYHIPAPSEEIMSWSERMAESGVQLFFVSNSKKPGRVKAFADEMGIGFITDAGKPKPTPILEAVCSLGKTPGQSALVGDQIFTDILGANRAGVTSILVSPITFKPYSTANILRALRRAAETPLRLMAHKKVR